MSYDGYFDGYIEQKVPKENGRGLRIKRIYVDDYIRAAIEDTEWRRRKKLYPFLYIVALLGYILAGSQPIGSNSVIYIVAPGLLAALMFLLSVVPLGFFATSKQNMTKWEYSTSAKRVKTYSLLTGCCLLTAALGTLIYLVFYRDLQIVPVLVSLLGYMTSGGILIWIYLREEKTEYRTEDNLTPISVEAMEI